jgi:hypothetical protein
LRAGIDAAFVAKLNAKLEEQDTTMDTTVAATQQQRSQQRSSLGEVLAAHVDLLCRRELKEASLDSDGEKRRMEVLVTLLMFLNERDIFQEAHRAKLAKRLLQTTPIMDLENQFLNKLQRALGKTYTFKMEAMLRDYSLTGEMQRLYAIEQQRGTGSMSSSSPELLSVHVLTASHWPGYRCDPMQPPKSLDACLRSFRFFYGKQHASRTLSWVHVLGTAQLQVTFPKGVKDIACSVFQAAILLTIAGSDCGAPESDTVAACSPSTGRSASTATSVSGIATALNLPLSLIKMHTASMCMHKMFQLVTLVNADGKPCPPNKVLHDGDRLAMNPNFVHKLRKFKLAAPVASKKDGEPGREEVETLRKAQTDAAIVRVMKSRRTLMFQEIEEQTTQQLCKLFIPAPKLLKLRVEDLINRAYLRRDENDRNLFHYVA